MTVEQPALRPPRLRTIRSVGALVLREMSATYGNSPGGYIWAILQPLGMVLILSAGFSLVLKAPSLGTNFTLFYATGYLPFLFYTTLSGKLAHSLRYSRTLLAYPGVNWIDSVFARLFLNFVTSAVVFCIVLSGILVIVDTRTVVSISPILQGIGICVVTGIGVGLMNCVLFGLAPIWEQIWTIISRPLFLASGILFIYEDLPGGAQDILWWNPLIHGTGLVRAGFYPTYHPDYVSLLYCYGGSMILVTLGLVFLRSKHKIILEK